MAIKNPNTEPTGDLVKKKFGFPNGFGSLSLGQSYFGYENDNAGIFRICSIQPKWRPGITSKANKTVVLKTDFYMQTKPRTANQIACALKFKNGMAAWALLTTGQQAVYIEKAIKLHMIGYNLFMREWMTS